MNFEEFLEPKKKTAFEIKHPVEDPVPQEDVEEGDSETDQGVEEIDVQKAVVEELAADKAEMNAEMENLKEEISNLKNQLQTVQEEKEAIQKGDLAAEVATLKAKTEELQSQIQGLKVSYACKVSELAAERAKEADVQERNPNALALLDRDPELNDRFPGETRDHVLEVIREARDKAEQEGRVRRAQLLEAVLVANEPNGSLAKKRAALEKFFNDNGNLVTGPVIEELTRCGISYKNGEEYLLPSEILKRTY